MTDYNPLLRSRFRSANIPVPYSGVYLTEIEEGVRNVQDLLERQGPRQAVETFVAYMSRGMVLRAEGHHDQCGKGLWISGDGSTLVAAALLQELLIHEVIESALYVDAFEYTDSKKPERSAVYDDRIFSDLLVLTEVSRLSEWATGLVYQLTRERYWRGLPTVIADRQGVVSEAVFANSVASVEIEEA